MNVLFLDIDGVLNSEAFFQVESKRARRRAKAAAKAQDPASAIDPANVAHLNTIVAKTRCEVVLSSSWRIGHTLAEVEGYLQQRGFAGILHDVTPELGGTAPRGDEIAAWLADHPEVASFVILDDCDDMGSLKHWLVRTGWAAGLTAELAEEVVKMMKETSDDA